MQTTAPARHPRRTPRLMPLDRNPAVDALRPIIAAVLAERPRTFAGRWMPDACHGTTAVATFDREAMDRLTLADLFGLADDIRASGAEPRLAFVFDAAQGVTGLVIGARVPDDALATQRTAADEMLARYRDADGIDGDGLDEIARQENVA